MKIDEKTLQMLLGKISQLEARVQDLEKLHDRK